MFRTGDDLKAVSDLVGVSRAAVDDVEYLFDRDVPLSDRGVEQRAGRNFSQGLYAHVAEMGGNEVGRCEVGRIEGIFGYGKGARDVQDQP